MLNIQKKTVGAVELLQVSGRVDSFTAPQLEQAIADSFKQKHYCIVVDLSGTDYFSSAGLRVLLQSRNLAQEHHHGGDVRLAGLSPFLQDAFQLVNFNKVFQIFPDSKEAIASF